MKEVLASELLPSDSYMKDMLLFAATYPSSVQRIQLCLAFLSCILIPALNAPEDALHVQASAVVHFHNNGGITEACLQLSNFLEAVWSGCQHWVSYLAAQWP